MPIAINGSGTITGLSTGGLPDGSIAAADLASDAITAGALPTGSILQVKQTHLTTADSQSLTAGTRAEISNLSVSITPISSTSDMLIFVRWAGESSVANSYDSVFGIRRDSTDIGNPATAGNRQVGIASLSQGFWNSNADTTPDTSFYSFLDTTRSSGTSQITYKATIDVVDPQTLYNQRTVSDGDFDSTERLTSTMIVMEVAA